MEAFETFVALALAEEGFIVSPAVKFPVARRTRRADREEVQEHGYEVDLVAARADRLVLATVKSFGELARTMTVTVNTKDKAAAPPLRIELPPHLRGPRGQKYALGVAPKLAGK